MLSRRLFFYDLFLPPFLAFWMLFGGLLFWRGWVPAVFMASMAGLCAMAFTSLDRGCRSALLRPALLLGLTAILSMVGNLDIFWLSLAWLLIYISGIFALMSSAGLGEDRLLSGLYWAGWIWLILWPLPRAWGWIDNRNLLAVWPVVSTFVILAKGKPWWWVLPHVGVLLALGSRGAILGLCIGLLVWYRPRVDGRRTALFAAAGAAFLWALVAFRPEEAFNRFSYWDQALEALFNHNLFIGLGPAGIYARHSIGEPGSQAGIPLYYQPHAHNLFFQVLAELGLVGFLALILSSLWILRTRFYGRWQLSILAALLVHCLVDLPIFFPGPWLVFMAVAGALHTRVPVPEHRLEGLRRPAGAARRLRYPN